jgi:hypothetical protein
MSPPGAKNAHGFDGSDLHVFISRAGLMHSCFNGVSRNNDVGITNQQHAAPGLQLFPAWLYNYTVRECSINTSCSFTVQ